MTPMRKLWLVAGIALAAGCGDDGDEGLTPFVRCSPSGECPADTSCLIETCIVDGSLVIGDTCLLERQCGAGLACHNFICKPGCGEMYTLDDCPEGQWCKPVPDADPPVGECSPSECDPSAVELCTDGSACVGFSASVGGCLPYCEYGFASATYLDNCTDTFFDDLSCQPLGIDAVPICLPSGDPNSGPTIGDAGCHGVKNPCSVDAICIDVVCRRLCRPGQTEPCAVGESCTAHAGRADLFYCRAN